MSISDEIVVLREGVTQQVGRPQEVYDKPNNLFVAKFLGTPPINIFEGRIENGKLMIGDANIGKYDAKDQEVTIGIRPEGFKMVERSSFKADVDLVETIGRDTTLIIKHPNDESRTFRAIVDADFGVEPGDAVKFNVKPHKMHIFNKETGELV